MTIAIDSNRYSDLRAGVPEVHELTAKCGKVFIPFPVLGELHYGFRKGSFREKNERLLAEYLSQSFVTVLWADEQTIDVYADLKLYLRNKGRPLPENDIWIAALCVRHGLRLYTRDTHFDQLPQVMRV